MIRKLLLGLAAFAGVGCTVAVEEEKAGQKDVSGLPEAHSGATIIGQLTTLDPSSLEQRAVSQARACAGDGREGRCTTTSERGVYLIDSIDVAGGFDVWFEHPAHPKVVAHMPFSAFWSLNLEAPTSQELEAFASAAGVEHDSSRGGILFRAEGNSFSIVHALAGGRVAVSGAIVAYADENGRIAAGSAVTSARGWGVVLGLPAGSVRVETSVDPSIAGEVRCGVAQDDGSFPPSVESTIVAGTLTVLTMTCVPAEPVI